MMAQFDWYQATVDAYPRMLGDALMEMPAAHDLRHGRGRMNYRESVEITDASGDVLATFLHGGANGAPNAYASGSNAEAFASIIRRHWPDAHRVTRLDSAEDFRGDFDELVPRLRAIGQAHSVAGNLDANDDPDQGDTYYLGRPSSAVRFRAYEKSKQLVATKQCKPEDVEPDLLRLEAQWRPVRDARTTASRLDPEAVWGVSPVLRHIASDVLAKAPERVTVRPRLRTTYEQRLAAFTNQYSGLMVEMFEAHGAWDLVGEEIGSMVEKHRGTRQ